MYFTRDFIKERSEFDLFRSLHGLKFISAQLTETERTEWKLAVGTATKQRRRQNIRPKYNNRL